MKNILFISLCVLKLSSLISQDAKIMVIPSTATINDRQDTVSITFDLSSNKSIQYYNIFLKITLDGEEIHAKGLSGDVGNLVKPGKGKKIIWLTAYDVLELSGTLKIEVLTDTQLDGVVTPGSAREIKIIPAYAGLGGTVVTAGTLGFIGLKAKSDYKDNYKPSYDIYVAQKDPNNATYYGNGKPSRQELYDEANSKYKKGQYYLIGAGVVLVGGGYAMISRIIKIKKYRKELQDQRSGSALLMPKPSAFAFAPTTINGVSGLKFTYTF